MSDFTLTLYSRSLSDCHIVWPVTPEQMKSNIQPILNMNRKSCVKNQMVLSDMTMTPEVKVTCLNVSS